MPAESETTPSRSRLDLFAYAVKRCEIISSCASEWLDFWQDPRGLRPKDPLSYHMDPDDSRLFGILRRLLRGVVKTGVPPSAESVTIFFEKFIALLESFRSTFKKKSLSKHAEVDIEVLDAMIVRSNDISTCLTKSATDEWTSLVRQKSDSFFEMADCLNRIIVRREAMVDGKEADEACPQVEIGKYAKAFIKLADQNVGLVVYKDRKIGAFYINRAARAAWKYLRPLLAATSKDGWVVIEGNVRQGFGRTTSENDLDRESDVVRLNRHIHCRQRGHTSLHEWRISTDLYENTEHV